MESPRPSQSPLFPDFHSFRRPASKYHIFAPPNSLHSLGIYCSLPPPSRPLLAAPTFFSKSNTFSPCTTTMLPPQPADYFNQLHSDLSPGHSPTPVTIIGGRMSDQNTSSGGLPSRAVEPPAVESHTTGTIDRNRPTSCTIASLLNPSRPSESPAQANTLKPAAIKRLLNEDDPRDLAFAPTQSRIQKKASSSISSSQNESHSHSQGPNQQQNESHSQSQGPSQRQNEHHGQRHIQTDMQHQRPSTLPQTQPAIDWRRHSAEDLSLKKRQRVSMISYPSAPHLSQLLYAPCVLPPNHTSGSQMMHQTPIPELRPAPPKTVVERFVCPYKFPGDNSRCKHDPGSFSRYEFNRSHLTSMHMEYPPKTRKPERETTPGKCMACGVWFRNPEDWISNHLNPGLCPGSLQVPNCLHKKYLFEEAKDTSLTDGIPYVLLSDSLPIDA